MDNKLMLEHVRYMFVIDDDPIQREMIKDHLTEKYIFDVKTYDNGEDAMADIEHLKPEIIVLDFYLNAHKPNAKNGLAILQDIKNISPKTQVIMFTGEDKIEVAMESMKHGAYDFIVKGESAFKKIEKAISDLGDIHRLQAIHKAQKRTITFLIFVIAIIMIAGIWYFSYTKR